ncbi:MAG: HlyC/CorC family transporter [Deltaproteobacteria bacterium]|nr:HlyC/CorC family transporter [Deltaproteobacteria bacterium]
MENESEKGVFDFIKSFLKKRHHLDNSEDLTEEIHDIMDHGQAKGLITDEESEMVCGVLDLKDTTASSIMVPRTEISSATTDSSIREIIDLVTECGHTRIPISKNSLDEIVGILHAKDILKLLDQDLSQPPPPEILREPYFVPWNQNVSDLLKDLRKKKTHLAIVTDEYGGTAGIITIEDIIEEIVGEIMDEYDNDEYLVKTLSDGSFLVDARLEIEKLEKLLGMDLPDGSFESVGGFIISLKGKIPEVNEKIVFDGIEMIIKKADSRKIDKVLIIQKSKPLSPSKPADDKI